MVRSCWLLRHDAPDGPAGEGASEMDPQRPVTKTGEGTGRPAPHGRLQDLVTLPRPFPEITQVDPGAFGQLTVGLHEVGKGGGRLEYGRPARVNRGRIWTGAA